MHSVQGRKSSAAGGRRQAAERGWQCSASSTSGVCSCPNVGFDLAKTRMRCAYVPLSIETHYRWRSHRASSIEIVSSGTVLGEIPERSR
eukprot:scaffold3101_cov202-Pinguiococcus_pyrenoidosus.AAC.1